MDRKIELDQLPEDMFNDLLSKVGADILEEAKKAQDSINGMLERFGLECRLSMSYLHAGQPVAPAKAKRAPRKKKSAGPA